jgi:hypothetical protein
LFPPEKNRFNQSQRPYLRAFRKPRPREGALSPAIGVTKSATQFAEKALAKPAGCHAGQGRNAGYCFDGAREQ